MWGNDDLVWLNLPKLHLPVDHGGHNFEGLDRQNKAMDPLVGREKLWREIQIGKSIFFIIISNWIVLKVLQKFDKKNPKKHFFSSSRI